MHPQQAPDAGAEGQVQISDLSMHMMCVSVSPSGTAKGIASSAAQCSDAESGAIAHGTSTSSKPPEANTSGMVDEGNMNATSDICQWPRTVMASESLMIFEELLKSGRPLQVIAVLEAEKFNESADTHLITFASEVDADLTVNITTTIGELFVEQMPQEAAWDVVS